MGIEPNIAAMIVREHLWRPIAGDVLLLGRQTMYFSPEAAVDMLQSAGLPVPPGPIETDRQTIASGAGTYIRDDEFFRLLGVPRLRALDHSDFEGADLVYDLNRPIPDSLYETADFILDGSTLDNVWDAASVLRNVVKMLKPEGRLISLNMGSNHHNPYTIITPQWLLDYFIVNEFSDCRIYVFVYDTPTGMLSSVYAPDPGWLMAEAGEFLGNFACPEMMGVVVMAEKGSNSTHERVPDQRQYRSMEDMASYRQKFRQMLAVKRPHLARSPRSPSGRPAPIIRIPGWLHVGEAGAAEQSDPQ